MTAYLQPVAAIAEHGTVILLGPGFEMPLSPEAALETCERVRLAAEEAMRQRREVRQPA